MAVYVDPLMQWMSGVYKGRGARQAERVGARHGHRWCHLFADEADCEELHEFAKRIGMRREWFQGNHYDLVPTRRALAVKLGAIELDRRGAVTVWRKQREESARYSSATRPPVRRRSSTTATKRRSVGSALTSTRVSRSSQRQSRRQR